MSDIFDIVRVSGDLKAIEDLYHLCQECRKWDSTEEERKVGLKWLRKLNEYLLGHVGGYADAADMATAYDLHKRILREAAPDDFDSFMLYIEWNRDADKKFYVPRRKQLMPIVEALQKLEDDELDLVTISLPPGVGKSTTAIFYLCWLAGKHPDKPMLGGSHSNSFIRGVYDECLRLLTGNGGEYLWSDVFPGVQLANTNAKDCRIDLGTRKRFETLQFTSIGSGNAGLYRAETILYCDDLVDGLETALSRDRLEKLWGQYTTDLRQRKIGKCKELHIATRWSVHDVIGKLEEQYGDSDRALFLRFPALDENDESNFDYPCSAGFSTEFYRTQRDIMDEISWKALYMNSPIERDGQLYSADELRRYFDLPDEEPDSIIAVCDTKDKGSDYCVMPIAYQYGQNFYIEDVICDNGKPEVVEERLIQMLVKRHVHTARFESNSAGGKIAEKVQACVKSKGGRTKITTKYSTANKETRIITAAGYAKEHFLFKADSAYPNKEYRGFINQLTNYTMMGKNKHDDVPDAISMLVDYIDTMSLGKVQVFARPW